MAHSKYSPSQLKRIITCPGSVQLYEELKPVQTSSEYAEEGTLLHSYMEKYLLSARFDKVLDAEHRAVCTEAAEYVHQYLTKTCDIFMEVKAAIEDLPEVFGTADLIGVDHEKEIIHIFDYKFGAHVRVDVEDNPQFYAYALGAIDTLGLDTTYKIKIHVVQPRMDNMYAVEISYNHLREWKENVLRPAILNAKSDSPKFCPSEEGCRWCLCKARCQACHTAAQEAAKTVFETYSLAKTRAAITPEELAAFYSQAAELKSQIKAVEEYVLTELLAGRKVPGYKVVHGRATRKWKDEVLAARYLSDTYDADPEDLYETKFKSPAQIEKIFKAAKKDQDLQKMMDIPQGAPKVVRDDAETQEVNPFSSVTEEKN